MLKAHGYLTSDVVHVGGMDGDGGEASRLRNELEVVILECRDLPARGRGLGGGIAPAAYAHYQVPCVVLALARVAA